jgi:solute carrier family 25 protein 16
MEDESYKKTNSYRIKTGVAGGVAGCMAKTAIAPMDRVKILFQTSHSDYIKYQNENFGFWRALKHIYNVHSIQGLFKGHSATLVRVFPYAGIKFAAYEQFKVYLKPNNPKNQGIFTLISASMAGIVAVLCTYPIELIRIKSAFETEKRLKAVVVEIFNEHPNGQRSKIAGLTGFYKGILPTIIGIIRIILLL